MKTIRQRNSRKRQRQTRKIYKKQHGGDFNKEQIKIIIQAMKSKRKQIEGKRKPEKFTKRQIKKYIKMLNHISQVQLSGLVNSFHLFYENMMNHLDGYEEETFKQWIDRVYDEQTERVETDTEEGVGDYDDRSDDEL